MLKKKLALAIGVLIASAVPTLYPRPVLATPPQSFPFSVGQPVTLNAGDTANITVILTTSDPNENGEGEGVVLSGAAGGVTCAMTVTDYFVPHVLQCGPVPFGDQLTLSSSYLGIDGDELAVGNADINTPAAVRKSQQYVDALDNMAHADDAVSNMYSTLEFICNQGPIGQALCLIGNHKNFGLMSAFEKGNGWLLAGIAADPPDSNYTQIAQPVLQYYPSMVFGSGVPQNVANDFNALFANYQEQTGLSFAIYTSLNRASGALQAGMTDWQNAQVAAAARYSYQLGAALKLETGLTSTLQKDLAAAGITVPISTQWQAYDVDYGFLINGLPTDQQDVLTKIGLTASDQQQVTNLSFVQSVAEISGLLSSSDGSSWLANPSRNADILAAASSLQQFALDNGYSPIDCSKATPSFSIIWPPNHKMVPIGITGVIDPDGSNFSLAVSSIQQDEPRSNEIDGSGLGTATAYVRAERDGNGTGRVYQIGFTAEDTSGATCTGSVLVGVPHDQAHPALDNGRRYSSTGP